MDEIPATPDFQDNSIYDGEHIPENGGTRVPGRSNPKTGEDEVLFSEKVKKSQ